MIPIRASIVILTKNEADHLDDVLSSVYAQEAPFAFEVNNVTAWSEVRRLAQAWASTLRKRLEELEKV